MNSTITLRPATAEDTAFLLSVYASTRAEELAMVPWSDEQKAAFIEMQFTAQHRDYHTNYPDADYDIILCDGTPAGRIYVHRRPADIHILDITLLPGHRNAGIGGALLARLIAEADAAGKAVGICVEKFNRAQTLYRRLGFMEADDLGVYWKMVRPAPAAG